MKYILKIPNPCNENWNAMTLTENGKFCAVCKKEVIDFRTHSNFQLAKKIHNSENICGRFSQNQLNTVLDSSQNKSIAKFSFLLGITSFFAFTQPTFSQNKSEKIENSSKDSIKKNELSHQIIKDSILIKGIVKDSTNNKPFEGVNIILTHTKIGTVTDFNGEFTLTVPIEYFEKEPTLEFSFLGYEVKKVTIYKTNKFLEVKLKEWQGFMGEIVIVRKQTFWQKCKNLFKRKVK